MLAHERSIKGTKEMNQRTVSLPQRTPLTHVHPALTIELQHSPFALVVRWDGMEIGTVTTYLAAEQLGKDWLTHLLDEDAMDGGDVFMAECPKTHWHVQPLDVYDVFELGGKRFAWWACPVCDWDENVRNEPDYNPAHPGPHLIALEGATPPPVWESRYQEVNHG